MSKEDEQANESEKKEEQTEEEREAEVLKVVSDAIDEATPPEKKDEATDDENANDPDGKTDPGDGTEVSPDGDVTPDKDGGNVEVPKEGEKTDKDPAADDGDVGEAESGDGASEKDDDDGVKPAEGNELPEKVDPVNDPIPESTNEKTSERIKSLIGIIKEKEGAQIQRDEILDEISATGAEPEQYAATLGFLKLYNSSDKADRQQALLVARGLVKELALDLGEGSTVVSLDDHDDLKAEVEADKLTETRALEIAATRDAKVLQTTREEEARNKRDATDTTTQNLSTGKEQLDSFEATVKSVDANYMKVRPLFLKLLKPVLKRTHPTEWGAVALELYEQVKTLPVAEETPKLKTKPKNEPLRPKGDAGGSGATPEAGSAVDAVSAAIENM